MKRVIRLAALVCLALGLTPTTGCRTTVPSATGSADVPAVPVQTGRFEQKVEGFRTPVLAFVPEDYDPHKTYGLVVFLHGTGMTGAQMVTKTPIGKINEAGYILLAPTSNYPRWGVGERGPRDARKAELTHLRNVIGSFEKTYNIDPHCVHTVGFSIGTVLLAHGIGFFGEWDGLKIRSMMGFSGGLEGKVVPAKASRADETAVWLLNGEKDRAHTAINRTVYEAFRQGGYDARISVPRGLGHEFPLIPYESMIDWWRELDGDRIEHFSPEVDFRRRKKEAVLVMRDKRFDEAQELLEQLQEEAPRDPQILYNLACLHALTGNPERALSYLDQAIEHGFRNLAHIRADSDLETLRGLDGFRQVIEKHRKQNHF